MKHLSFICLAFCFCSCKELTQNDKKLRTLADFSFDKCRDYLIDEIESDKENDYLYYRLADLYEHNHDDSLAINNYYNAINIAPQKKDYYKKIIPCLLEAARWHEAEIASDKLKELAPSFYHAYYYLVKSCVEQKKTEKAGTNLKLLTQINTGYPDLAYLKGLFYLAKKDTLDAIYSFELSIDQNQRASEIIFYLANIYITKGDIAKAKKILEKFQDHKDLNKFQFHKMLGDLAERENRKQEAIAAYKRALTFENNCLLRYTVGGYHLEKWQLDSARHYIDTTLDCEKDRNFYFYNGLLNYRSGNYEEAVKNYKFAIEIEPEDPKVTWRYNQALNTLNPPTVEEDSTHTENNKDTIASIRQ